MNTKAAACIAIAATSGLAAADVTVNPIFGDRMVVQRDQPVLVWGEADPGDTVTVTLHDRIGIAKAAADGSWEASLDPLPAGGPHRLAVSTSDDSVTFADVLVGDVWVCSGQSNMDWRLELTDRGAEFIESSADVENVRLFKVERAWSESELNKIKSDGWQHPAPNTTTNFSAVGYHFGRLIAQETGVPVGLIHTAWGGTPAEAWTRLSALEAQPDVFADRLETLKDFRIPADERERRLAEANRKYTAYVARAWSEDAGAAGNWQDPSLDAADWPTMKVPGDIRAGLASFEGVVWLRRSFDLSGDWTGSAATLELSQIDDFDKTYINGTLVGSTLLEDAGNRDTAASIRRRYTVPEGVLTEGENTIAIAVMNARTAGGVRDVNLPVRLSMGDTQIDLAGQWGYRVGFAARENGRFPAPGGYGFRGGLQFKGPAALYNGMIHPLTRFGVKGAIWYQGESNAGRAEEYADLFPAMIQSWRDAWTEGRGEGRGESGGAYAELPFYFVQLPNFRKRVDEPSESGWATLRESQRLTLERLPNTGMAITIEIGDPGDIHPRNKLPVAERLARLALADHYGGETDNASGPLMTGATRIPSGSVIVQFDHAAGLTTSDGSSAVLGFALQDTGGEWRWAKANIRGTQILVYHEDIQSPRAIRYAWADNPAVNLVNSAGLPASPFEAEFGD